MKWYDWLNPITWVLLIHWFATEIVGNCIILFFYKLKGGVENDRKRKILD